MFNKKNKKNKVQNISKTLETNNTPNDFNYNFNQDNQINLTNEQELVKNYTQEEDLNQKLDNFENNNENITQTINKHNKDNSFDNFPRNGIDNSNILSNQENNFNNEDKKYNPESDYNNSNLTDTGLVYINEQKPTNYLADLMNIEKKKDTDTTIKEKKIFTDKVKEDVKKSEKDAEVSYKNRLRNDNLINHHLSTEDLMKPHIHINPEQDYDKYKLKEFQIYKLDDLKAVNEWIKYGRVAIIDLRQTNPDVLIRIVDIITGILLAHGGTQKKLISKVFILSSHQTNIEPYYLKMQTKIQKYLNNTN